MCGRKTLTWDIQSIITDLKIDHCLANDFQPSYNIAPTQLSPILYAKENSRIIRTMNWGLIPHWSKDQSISPKMINARSETILEKPSFQNLINQNRCIIIADGYYEWKNSGHHSQPYYIYHKNHTLLPMAGLWTTWQSEENIQIQSYTIITTNSQPEIDHIHTRMPIILNPKDIDQWIQCNTVSSHEALQLLVPYIIPLSFHPVSSKINSTKNNSADCIDPINYSPTMQLF